MSRPVVQLHTIKQWFEQDQNVRSMVLQNIRLKSRLQDWMYQRSQRPPLMEPVTEPCYHCHGTGQVTHLPRLTGIHPSQVSNDCMLKIYNQMIGKEPRGGFDFRLQLIFDLGTAVHLMFQGYGRKGAWGPHYQDEVRISEEFQQLAYDYFLEGSADAVNLLVIDDIPNAPIFEIRLVHEYKSINDNGFKKLTAPKPEHKQQAMIYAAALDIPVVVYMYLNKNDSNLSDFPVAFDWGLWNNFVEPKARRLNQFYDRGEPPPGTVDKFSCPKCEFSYDCPDYTRVLGGI